MNQRCRSQNKLKVQPQATPAAQKPKPQWNNEIAENPHKLSRAELLQKKLNSKSKNEIAAKEELKQKLDKLKSGIIPKDYKDYTQKGTKKFQSKEAFIKDKHLEKEYENRSYVSKPIVPCQVTMNTVDSINDRIQLQTQQNEVKFTSVMSQPQQRSMVEQRQVQTNEAQSEELDEIQAILKRVNIYQGVSHPVFIPTNQTDHKLQEEHRVYLNEQLLPQEPARSEVQFQQYQPTFQEIKKEQPEQKQAEFDYLDYKENEDRLEKIRQQNMGFFNHLQTDKPQVQNDHQASDFDILFQKLNQNLQGGTFGQYQPPKAPQFQMQSGFSITPIKETTLTDSPKSLLPNYANILQFNDSQPSKQAFDYSRAPPVNDYEPRPYGERIQSAQDILGSQSMVTSNPLQNKTLQTMAPVPAPQQFYPVEDDSQIQKMREMLLSTQQEIDKIIQGSSQVNEIYQTSKDSQGQFIPVNKELNKAIPVYGQQIVKEQHLGRGPLHDRSNFYQNQAPSMQSMGKEDDDLKPRYYPFGQSMSMNPTYNAQQSLYSQPPAYSQYRCENSLSLKSHLQF